MSTDNVAFVQRAYHAIATGDMAWIHEHAAPDVVFEQGGSFPTAGVYHGRDAMMHHIGEFMALVGGNLSLEPVDFLSSSDRVAVVVHVTIEFEGRELTFDEVQVWSVSGDQLTEMRALPFEARKVDEFFASASTYA